MWKRCKPNLGSHASARFLGKRPYSRQQMSNAPYTKNNTRNQSNGHNDPNLHLYISTSKPDHIAELLEAKRKMTQYLNSHTNTTKHTILALTVTTPVTNHRVQCTQTNTNASHTALMMKSMKLLDKHIHLIIQN